MKSYRFDETKNMNDNKHISIHSGDSHAINNHTVTTNYKLYKN